MKLVIDMNLSPDWLPLLRQAGHIVTHWSSVGSPRAKDREILRWARERRQVVFTHDLDFGAILAATDADSPSVIQIRTQDPTPEHCGRIVAATLHRYADALKAGALISVDENRARVRLLPLRQRDD
jgi:predicted nuclease of predicted toxin-antitoxin system